MNTHYESLANAIILRAVKDYRKALQRLEKYPGNKPALGTKREVEQFFNSDWYALLTDVDTEKLIQRLNEEVEA